MSSPSTSRWPIFLVVAALALGAGVLLRYVIPGPRPLPVTAATLLPTPKPLPDFSLRDQQDRAITKAALRGHWSLLFFGYTHCPDVCPTTLADLSRALALVKNDNASHTPLPRVYFVSVDPQRDTPASLQKYVSYFNKDFVGATGDRDALFALTRAFDTTFFYGPPDSKGNYEVGHSAAIYFIDPQARIRAISLPPNGPTVISRDYMAIVNYYGGKDE
jgi:protein SCO1/2